MRYRTLIADSDRWLHFRFRPGDIVISTPPKCGTTWTQMLCALLVFDGPELPRPLGELSPWLDMLTRPIDDVVAMYDAQDHRRFIKTHTPLDGLPLRPEATYVVVGRDPRDVAVSMQHHNENLDMDRVRELRAETVDPADDRDVAPRVAPADPEEWLEHFIEQDDLGGPASLALVLNHLSKAWEHRRDPNVALFHYTDYRADLPAELRRLASALEIPLTAPRAAELATEASIERMRERADKVVPSAELGIWRDTSAFLRAGSTGEGAGRIAGRHEARYAERVRSLVPPDLAAWAHEGRIASGVDPDS